MDILARVVITRWADKEQYGCELYRINGTGREFLNRSLPFEMRREPRTEEEESDIKLRVLDATLRQYGGPSYQLGVTMLPESVSLV